MSATKRSYHVSICMPSFRAEVIVGTRRAADEVVEAVKGDVTGMFTVHGYTDDADRNPLSVTFDADEVQAVVVERRERVVRTADEKLKSKQQKDKDL